MKEILKIELRKYSLIFTREYNQYFLLPKHLLSFVFFTTILSLPCKAFASNDLWWTGDCNNDFSVLENWSSTPLECDGSGATLATNIPTDKTKFHFTDGSFSFTSEYAINFDVPISKQNIFIEGFGNAERVI